MNKQVKDIKMKKVFITILSTLLICGMLLLTGCSSDNSITGTWVSENGEEVLIFEEDGSCSVPFTYDNSWWESCDRYSIADDSTLVLSSSQGNISAERYTLTDSEEEATENSGCYYLSDDTLIFHRNSKVYTYNRSKTNRAIADTINTLDEKGNTESETQKSPVDTRTYSNIGSFSEEKMWLTYIENGLTYVSCVNKEGRALFQYKAEEVSSTTPFINGFAYITFKNDFSVIDSTGKILFSYPAEEYGEVKAYGDGYVLTESYKSDFDSAYYLYTIYDSTGKVIKDFTITDGDQIRAANYCGEGVFGIQMRGSWEDPTEFYFINLQKFVKLQGDINCRFSNEKALVNIEYADPDYDGYRARLVFLTSTGETQYVPVYQTYGWNWTDGSPVSESCCIIYWPFSDGVLVNYNIDTKEFFMADEYYVEKIDWDAVKTNFYYDSGVFAAPLVGSDNKKYIVVFDKTMNNVTEPIEYTSFENYSNGRMFLTNSSGTFVYDETGKIVFNLKDIGAEKISAYAENIAVVDNKRCIDLNGNTVFNFDDIIFSEAITY